MEPIFKEEDKILIVAPHQDDETFGCGGLMSLYGKICDVLLLTDGCKGNIENFKNEDELVNIRNKELEIACEKCGINKLYRLDIKNEELYKNKNKVYSFDISKYTYIFLPNRNEDHIDHKVCYSIFSKMKRRQHSKAQIYEYEVWTPLLTPTWFLDISEVINKKKELIKIYKSQIEDKDYLKSIIGLNMYRGMYKNYQYCEAYKYSAYNKFSESVYRLLPESIKEIIRKAISR